jgi:hypothetical protein
LENILKTVQAGLGGKGYPEPGSFNNHLGFKKGFRGQEDLRGPRKVKGLENWASLSEQGMGRWRAGTPG